MKHFRNISLAVAALGAFATLCGCADYNSGAKAGYPNDCPYKNNSGKSCANNATDCPAATANTDQTKNDVEFIDGKILEPYFGMLKNTSWAPTFLVGQGDLKTPMEDGKYVAYMRFNEDCRMNGNAGDNLIGGNLSITKNGAFIADKVYSTRMLGPNTKYEILFMKALSQADKIVVNGDTLMLSKGADRLLEFKKIKEDKIFNFKK